MCIYMSVDVCLELMRFRGSVVPWFSGSEVILAVLVQKLSWQCCLFFCDDHLDDMLVILKPDLCTGSV